MSMATPQHYVVTGQGQTAHGPAAVANQAHVNEQVGMVIQPENVPMAVDLGNGQVGFVSQQKMMTPGAQAGYNTGPGAIVVYQPQVAVNPNSTPTGYSSTKFDYACGTYTMALILTIIYVSLLCLWALPFSLAAVGFAYVAEHSHNKRKKEHAKGYKISSIVCSIVSIISVIVVPIIIAGAIVGSSTNSNNYYYG